MSGIILSGAANFASVTDESSPDTRSTGRVKVPIYAQVLTEEPLDWFYDILRFFPDIGGELKGTVVVAQFDSLPRNSRRRIWNGLRRVRIHVTDPRIFLAERDGIYLEVAGGPFPVAELRDRERRGDPMASRVLRVGDEFVARRILMESSPFRLALKVVQVDEAFGMIGRAHEIERPLGYDVEAQLSAIRAKKQGVVTRAAEFASKAGAVFAEADDQVLTVKVKAMFESQFGGVAKAVHKAVLNTLRQRHAYDRGDEKLLGNVQATRDRIGKRVEQLADPFGELERVALKLGPDGLPLGFAEPLASIESFQVAEGQASDIAARMAATLYEREGLPGLVKRFDFVTFNGERVAEHNVDEILRSSQALRN